MDHSASPATQHNCDSTSPQPSLVATIVPGPEHSKLRSQRPEVLRVKVARSPDTGATTVLAGWPEPESWSTTNWGSTIARMTRLLANELSLDPNAAFPSVPLAGLVLYPLDQDHPEPGIELLFDPRPVARMEVVIDRVTPDADSFLWLFSSLWAASAYATLQTEAPA